MSIHWSKGMISVEIATTKAVATFLWWTKLSSWSFRLKW